MAKRRWTDSNGQLTDEGEKLVSLRGANLKDIGKEFPKDSIENLRANLKRLVAGLEDGNITYKGDVVEDVVSETQKDRKIVALQDEVRHLRRLYKEQTRQASGSETLLEAIYEILPTYEQVPVPPRLEVGEELEVEELVLLLSDLHFGEVVDEAETGGIASFNLDIAKRRLDYTIDKAIVIAKEKQKGYHYRRMNVFLMGDLISGLIHDELRESNEVGVVQQMLYAVEVLTPQILRLCSEFPEVRVTSVVGNHGRVKEQYYFKGKANNNYDYLVSKMMEKLTLSQPNLTWNIPESFWAVEEVCGQKFLLMHGDAVKSWAGIPWYGLDRLYKKWRVLQDDYGLGFHHMCIGHFHNPNVFTVVRGKLFVNGSIKGGDEYAIGAISAACDPVQLMFGVNPTRWGHTTLWDINSAHVK